MDTFEQRICQIIDSRRSDIIAFGRDVCAHAELGYKEFETAAMFARELRALNLTPREGVAVTGVAASICNGDGANVALMGELDALPIPTARHANPKTGAAHCCGHNFQLAGVLGAAMALTDPKIMAQMSGKLTFFGVPAEECIDLEYRQSLADGGKIGYIGGKCELIRLGELDGIDVVVGHHSGGEKHAARLCNGTSNGFVCKNVRFIGKAAHAAGEPHAGIDALSAASLAMHALDAQRESFKDGDHVRIHGYISSGGAAVNVIADDVTMQYLVRAATVPAIKDASYKFDRAMAAAALATGCGVEIHTLPGYLPVIPCTDTEVLESVIDLIALGKRDPDDKSPEHGAASTDFGDVSYVKPLLQFNTGGITGIGHHPSYDIADEEIAYIMTAKIFALTAYRLLKNGGAEAKKVAAAYTPPMSKAEYLAYMEGMKHVKTSPQTPPPEWA